MEEGIQKYLEILKNEPGNIDALRGLSTCYEEMGRTVDCLPILDQLEGMCAEENHYEEVSRLLERRIGLTESAKDKSDQLCRLGEVYRKHLHNKNLAIEAYVKALELDYEKSFILEILGEIYGEKNENFGDVVEYFKSEAERTPQQSQRHTHWLEIADIYAKVLSQPQKALSYYQKVLAENLENPIAIDSVEKFYIQHSRWSDLVEFYRTLIQHYQVHPSDKSLSETISLYFRLAVLFRDELQDPYEAMCAYDNILKTAPHNVQVRHFIERLLSQTSLWQSIAQNFLEEAHRATSLEDKLSNLKKSARVFSHYLEDTHAGLKIYHEILSLHPEDNEALETVRAIYTQNKDWDGLVHLYETIVNNTTAFLSRIRLFNKIGALYHEQLTSPTLAITFYDRSLKEAPADFQHGELLNSLRALEVLYGETKDWQALAPILERLMSHPDEAGQDQQISHTSKLAKIYSHHLEESEKAIALYRKTLTLDPQHLESLLTLEDLYRSKHDWEGLRFTYDRLIHVAQDPSRQLDTFKKYAHLMVDRFRDFPKAISLLKRAQTLHPQDVQSSLLLEHIYQDQKDWPQLVDLYEMQSKTARSAEIKSLCLRKAAEVYERHIKIPEKAIETYRQALTIEDKSLKTIRSLQNLYEKTKNWDALIELCQHELDLDKTSAVDRIPIYLRLAETREHRQNKVEEAIPYYQKVLEIDDKNLSALKALERLYLRSEKWAQLLETYHRQIVLLERLNEANQTDPLLQIYRRISRIYMEKLPNPTEAESVNESILRLAPEDPEAIRNLKHLYQDRKKWVELINTLLREISVRPPPRNHSQILSEIALIFSDKLGDEQHGLEYLEQAHEAAPQDPAILARLSQRYEKTNQWDQLIAVYRRQLQSTNLPQDKIRHLEKIAAIQLQNLGKPEDAQTSYETILSVQPNHLPAYEALYLLYSKLDRFDALIELNLRFLQQDLPAKDKARLHFMTGETFEQHLRDDFKALDHYRLALECDRSQIVPLHAICRILKRSQNWGEYLRYAKMAADLSKDRDEKVALFVDMGEIWNQEFHQTQKAIHFYHEALRLKPSHLESLRKLWQLFLAEGDWARVIELGPKLLHLVFEEADQVNIRLEMGRIYARQMADPGKGASLLQEALALNPKNSKLIRELREIQTLRKKWDSVIELAYQQLEQTHDLDEKLPILEEIALTWKNKLLSPANALRTYREILDIDPLHLNSLRALGELIPDPLAWKEIQKEVTDALGESVPLETQLQSLYILADIWNDRFQSYTQAVLCLEIAQGLDPKHLETLTQLAEIHYKARNWQDFLHIANQEIHILESLSQTEIIQSRLIRRYRLCAAVYSGALQEAEQARSFLQRARQIAPQDLNLLRDLEPIYLELKRWQDLLTLYRVEADLIETPPDKASVLLKIADLLYTILADPDQAETVYSETIALDPRNLSALSSLSEIKKKKAQWHEALTLFEQWAKVLGTDPKAISIYLEMAGINKDHTQDLATAEKWARRALELDTRNLEAIRCLQSIYLQGKQFENLLQMYQKEATLYLDDKREIELFQLMADLYEKEFANIEKASQCYRRLVQMNPNQEDSWDKTQTFLKRNTLFALWVELLDFRIDHCEFAPSLLGQLRYQQAILCLEELKEFERSISYLEAALRAQPSDLQSVNTLIGLFHNLNRNEDLIDALERKAILCHENHDTATTLTTLFEIADLWQHSLESVQNAEETYLRILELDKKNAKALEALRELYRDAQRWDAYANVLTPLLSLAKDSRQKASLHLEIAEVLHHRLADAEKAILHYESCLTHRPSEQKALHALDTLYLAKGDWKAYMDLLTRRYHATENASEQFELCKKQGDIYLSHLQEPAQAILCYEVALSHGQNLEESNRQELLLPIWQALRPLYRQALNWQALLRVLEAMIRSFPGAKDPDISTKSKSFEKVDLLLEKADIEEKELSDKSAARKTIQALLKLLPRHKRALETLLRLQESKSEKDRKKTLEILQDLLDLETDPIRKADLHFRLSHIYVEASKEQNFHLKKALGLSPEHQGAIRKLKELAFEKNSYDEAIAYLRMEAKSLVSDPLKMSDIYVEIGQLELKHQDNEEGAIASFREALQGNPQHPQAILALSNIFYARKEWLKAESYLNPLSLKVGTHSSSAKIDGVLADDEIFFRLGNIAFQLGKHDDAVMRFLQAIHANPEHQEALKMLGDLFFTGKQWKNAAPVYESLLKKKVEPISSTHYRLGMIHYHLAQNPQNEPSEIKTAHKKAKEHLLHVLRHDETHTQALSVLIEIHIAESNYREALDYLAKLVLSSRDEVCILSSLCKTAEIQYRHLNQIALAIETYQRVLSLDAEYEPALSGLCQIYQAKHDWPKALEILARLRSIVTEPSILTELYYQESRIYGREIGDQNLALAHLERALERTPAHMQSLEEITWIHRSRGHWDKLLEHLRYCLRVSPKEQLDEMVKLQMELGEVLLEHLNQPNEAETLFRDVLQKQPHNLQARLFMAKVHERSDKTLLLAIQEYQEILTTDLSHKEVYEGLVNLHHKLRNQDQLFISGSILEFLGSPVVALEKLKPLAQERFQTGNGNPLKSSELEELLIHPQERGPLRHIFSLLGDQTPKILPESSIPEGSSVSLQTDILIRTGLRCFELDGVKISQGTDNWGQDRFVLPVLPKQIVVGQDFDNISSEGVRRFLLGRAFYYLLSSIAPEVLISEQDLRRFLVALTRHFHPHFAPQWKEDETYQKFYQNFKKTLSRGLKKDLREVVNRFAETSERINFSSWIEATRHSANRLGLLLCQEPRAALLAIAQYPEGASSLEGNQIERMSPQDRGLWLQQSSEARELLRFAFSQNYLDLRRRLGLHL